MLGVIYSRAEEGARDERVIHNIDDLKDIASVIKDFGFFLQEKYKIASDTPGSGNTKNIGSVKSESELKNGAGPFSDLGEDMFDQYWSCYLTKGMAMSAQLEKPPYNSLDTFLKYRGLAEK